MEEHLCLEERLDLLLKRKRKLALPEAQFLVEVLDPVEFLEAALLRHRVQPLSLEALHRLLGVFLEVFLNQAAPVGQFLEEVQLLHPAVYLEGEVLQ